MNKNLFIILGVLGVLVIAGGVFWYISSQPPQLVPEPIVTNSTEDRPVSGDTGPVDSTASINRDLEAINLGSDSDEELDAIQAETNSL